VRTLRPRRPAQPRGGLVPLLRLRRPGRAAGAAGRVAHRPAARPGARPRAGLHRSRRAAPRGWFAIAGEPPMLYAALAGELAAMGLL